MNEINKKLKDLSIGISSKWKQNAENRLKNKWMSYSSQIARRILFAINENEELNQTKLATTLNVSPQQISKIVKGRENMTLETIYKLSQALKVDLISFPKYGWNETKNVELNVSSKGVKADIYVILVIQSQGSQSSFINNYNFSFNVKTQKEEFIF